MSTHPNVILLLRLTPDDLARKTFRAIRDEVGGRDEDEGFDFKIDEVRYSARVMESDYYKSQQISANSGDIIVWDHVTYGYGARVTWEKLEAQKIKLQVWADGICERHHCAAEISVTANYW